MALIQGEKKGREKEAGKGDAQEREGEGVGEGEEVKEGEGVVLLIRRVGLPHEGGSLPPQGVERREKGGKEEGEVMILVKTEETTA